MMKNYHILAAAALLTLAACSKNEVRPASSDPQEITFQTVVGGVKTKAPTASQKEFSHKFYSYAYFLQSGSWDTADLENDAKSYISSSLIEKNSEGIWKNKNTTYYWPKQGNLTFFAWTDDTDTPEIVNNGGTLTCTATDGIKVVGYDAKANKNKDLMVAEVKKDQKSNAVPSQYYTVGVPTLFHHVLSNLAFKVKTDKAYTDNEKFAMKSITLKNVMTNGNYTQGSVSANTPENVWSDWSVAEEMPLVNNTDAVEFTNDGQDNKITITDYSIVLPQKFDSTTPVIEIVYNVTTNYSGTPVVETVTVKKPLKDIYKDNWIAGKKYTLTITIGLDEIRWDPAVEDWTEQGYDITL